MATVLNLYDSKDKLLKTSSEITGDTASILIENLIPNTTYNAGVFKIAWSINGKESNKVLVPTFKTLESANKQAIVFNTLSLDASSFIVSDTAPSDTSKLWFKPVD